MTKAYSWDSRDFEMAVEEEGLSRRATVEPASNRFFICRSSLRPFR